MLLTDNLQFYTTNWFKIFREYFIRIQGCFFRIKRNLLTTEPTKYGIKFINKRKLFKECLSLKLNKKEKENKIFSKQFVTTELTKYGLKFSVLSIIMNERKLIKKCLSLKFKRKKMSY